MIYLEIYQSNLLRAGCLDNSQSGSTPNCWLCFEVPRALKNDDFMADNSAEDYALPSYLPASHFVIRIIAFSHFEMSHH
jgi:hypothetical protein